MATNDLNTSKTCDGLTALADCYEALANMANNDGWAHTPLLCLLDNLNRQLRAFLDEADSRGELS